MRQNEDYSLGDNISDSSEKLLQRGWGEISSTYDFIEGRYMQSNTHFERFAASHEELMVLVHF